MGFFIKTQTGSQDNSKVIVLFHVCCHGLCNTQSWQHTIIKSWVKQDFGPLQLAHSADTRPEDNEFHWEQDKCFDHLHLYRNVGLETDPPARVIYAVFMALVSKGSHTST